MASGFSPANICGMLDDNQNEESKEESGGAENAAKRFRLTETAVHQHFTKVEEIGSKSKLMELRSKCNHCSASYKGKNPTNLRQHLESKHPEIAKAVKDEDGIKRLEKVSQQIASTSKASSNKESKSSALLGKWVGAQPRLASLWPQTEAEKEDTLRAVALWVGGSFTPLSAVDDPGFELVLKSLDIRVSQNY